MPGDWVCPSCGNLVVELEEITGWCLGCAGALAIPKKCVRCKNLFLATENQFICIYCKTEDWANEIEELIARGCSFSRAKQLIAKNNQAVCLCCGDTMPRATKGRHSFCSKSKCRSASRRVKHLRTSRSLTYDQAISQVLGELKDAA